MILSERSPRGQTCQHSRSDLIMISSITTESVTTRRRSVRIAVGSHAYQMANKVRVESVPVKSLERCVSSILQSRVRSANLLRGNVGMNVKSVNVVPMLAAGGTALIRAQ